MESDVFKRPKWAEILITSCIMVFTPLLVFGFLLIAFIRFTDGPLSMVQKYTCFFFGFAFGVLADITLALLGMFSDAIHNSITRIKDFFSNLSISFKDAFNWYLDDFKEHGFEGLLYLFIFLINIAGTIISFIPLYDFFIAGIS